MRVLWVGGMLRLVLLLVVAMLLLLLYLSPSLFGRWRLRWGDDTCVDGDVENETDRQPAPPPPQSRWLVQLKNESIVFH